MALAVSATATATMVTATISGIGAVAVAVRLTTPGGVVEAAGTRTGNGIITLVPLDSGRKFVVAWLTGGTAAITTEVVVPSTDEPEVAWYRVTRLDRVPGDPYMRARVERTEKPVESQ